MGRERERKKSIFSPLHRLRRSLSYFNRSSFINKYLLIILVFIFIDFFDDLDRLRRRCRRRLFESNFELVQIDDDGKSNNIGDSIRNLDQTYIYFELIHLSILSLKIIIYILLLLFRRL